MVLASELKPGMVVRIEEQVYRVLEVESRAAIAKLGGLVKAELSNVKTGRLWEIRLRPHERMEELQVERHIMKFLYRAGDTCTFMNPYTYEQVEVPCEILGPAESFLQSDTAVPLDFFEGKPISAVLPDVVEARVVQTTPPAHSQQDSAWKEATLENGLVIRIPLFIGPEENVRVEVRTGRYLERAHAERRRTA